jgi:uncharacterized protein (TIGR03067 family)
MLAAGPAVARADKEATELQGTWRLTSVEINGEPNDATLGRPHWIIQGNKVRYAGEDLAVLTADAGTTPKTFDLALVKPKKTYEGVYSVQGDTLKVCLNGRSEGVKERPQGFDTKDKPDLRLLVFKREAGKDSEPAEFGGYAGLALRADPDRNEIVINDIIEDSPAKKAGLKKGDVILKIADGEVGDLRSAVERVRRSKPGQELAFRVRRDDKEQDVRIKVGVVPFAFLAQLD